METRERQASEAFRLQHGWLHAFFVSRKLLLHCSLLVFPMIAFTAILLGLVYHYEWSHHHAQVNGLELSTSWYSDVFYVDLSATKLILVASWPSSTVLTLIGSFMTLVSFVVAADMIWTTELNIHQLLPSAAQLAILIDLLDNKRPALLRWFTNIWSERKARRKSLWLIELIVIVQMFALFISCAVIATDTWLHISTESVNMPFYRNASPANLSASYMFSRLLTEDCLLQSPSSLPCSVRQDGRLNETSTAYPAQIRQLWSTADNLENEIYLDAASDYSYIGPPLLDFDSGSLSTSSEVALKPQFSALTFAMKTTCSFATSCGLESLGSAFAFKCPKGFENNRTTAKLAIGPWYNSSLDFESLLAQNKDQGLAWGIFANISKLLISPKDEGKDVGYINFNISKTVQYATVLLHCNSSIATTPYSWANGSITAALDPSPGNITLNSIIIGPLLAGLMSDQASADALSSRIALAGQFKVEDVLTTFASALSEIGLGFLAGSIQSAPATSIQLGDSMVVTRVPKAPLFTLVLLNLWYAGLGLMLYLIAVYVLQQSKNILDVVEVQQLLTVEGLTAAAVMGPRGRQKDSVGVGVVKSPCEPDGHKWHFRICDSSHGDLEQDSLIADQKSQAGVDGMD